VATRAFQLLCSFPTQGDLRSVRYLFEKGELKNKVDSFISVDGLGARISSGGVGSYRYRVTYRGRGGHSYGSPVVVGSATVSHVYGAKGTYKVTLSVTDAASRAAQALRDVTVKQGGRLTLATTGVYNFVSLDLEPGSIVVLPSGAGLTQIRVHSGLILRSPLTGNARTILAFPLLTQRSWWLQPRIEFRSGMSWQKTRGTDLCN